MAKNGTDTTAWNSMRRGRTTITGKSQPLPRNRERGWLYALFLLCGRKKSYFFWTYFRQSSITATRMMMPENTNCRLVSMPRTVRE